MIATSSLRRVLLLAAPFAAASLMLVWPAAAQGREGTFDRTLTVTGAVDLEVQSGSGQVRVTPGAAGSVHVVAKLRGDNSWIAGGDVEKRIRQIEQHPPIEQQGNVVRIGRFADSDLARNISISYDVTVPSDTKLAANTGSGDIEIGELKGAVDVKSGSGDVSVGRVGGHVAASTGSGDIRVVGAASFEAHTGSGDIRATGVAGPASANSGSGSVTIAQAGKGNVSVSAASGDVTLTNVDGPARINSASGDITIDGRPSGPWSLHSSSGDIAITVPPDAAFDLDARTNSGSIDSVHPVTMTLTGQIDKRHIEGKVRGGGPMVQASCSSGSIRIK